MQAVPLLCDVVTLLLTLNTISEVWNETLAGNILLFGTLFGNAPPSLSCDRKQLRCEEETGQLHLVVLATVHHIITLNLFIH